MCVNFIIHTHQDRLLKRVKGDTLAAVATLSRTRRYQEHVAVRACYL